MTNGLYLKHKIGYCGLCQTFIIVCRSCGNNCCNGTYGVVLDGSKCVDCPSAYAEQDEMWKLRNREYDHDDIPEEKLLRAIFNE